MAWAMGSVSFTAVDHPDVELTGTTGYSYEPWHLRYVGKELAVEMKRRQIALGAKSLLLHEQRPTVNFAQGLITVELKIILGYKA